MLKFANDLFYPQFLLLVGLLFISNFSQLALTGGLVLVVKTNVVSAVAKMFVQMSTVIVPEHVAMAIRDFDV